MRLYIAGPMRGYPEHNIPAFERAANLYRALGQDVVSPVEVGAKLGGQDCGLSAEDFVRADLVELLTCNGIVLLPGWEASTGARCEATVAVTLGFRFFDHNGFTIKAPELIQIRGGYDRQPGRVESLDAMLPEIRAWQAATFPAATPHSIAKHLAKEALELLDQPEDAEEMADVFLLLAGASRHIDLAAVVRAKLEKNKLRKWGTPDADGVVQHVDEGAAA